MKYALLLTALGISTAVFADLTELSDGRYVDEYGDIHDEKYPNEDISAPWNDPLKQDDILAPWNDPLHENDPLAPWNSPITTPRETNEYLRDQGERNADYYWD